MNLLSGPRQGSVQTTLGFSLSSPHHCDRFSLSPIPYGDYTACQRNKIEAPSFKNLGIIKWHSSVYSFVSHHLKYIKVDTTFGMLIQDFVINKDRNFIILFINPVALCLSLWVINVPNWQDIFLLHIYLLMLHIYRFLSIENLVRYFELFWRHIYINAPNTTWCYIDRSLQALHTLYWPLKFSVSKEHRFEIMTGTLRYLRHYWWRPENLLVLCCP